MDQQIQNTFHSMPFFVVSAQGQLEKENVSLEELEHAAKQFVLPSEFPESNTLDGAILFFKLCWNKYVVTSKDLVKGLLNKTNPLLDQPENIIQDQSNTLKSIRAYTSKAALDLFKVLEGIEAPETVLAIVRSTLSLEIVQVLDLVKEPVVMNTYLRLRNIVSPKPAQP